MFDLTLAAIEGNIHVAAAAIGIPLGIGLIGAKACESVGRNPEAATKVPATTTSEAGTTTDAGTTTTTATGNTDYVNEETAHQCG